MFGKQTCSLRLPSKLAAGNSTICFFFCWKVRELLLPYWSDILYPLAQRPSESKNLNIWLLNRLIFVHSTPQQFPPKKYLSSALICPKTNIGRTDNLLTLASARELFARVSDHLEFWNSDEILMLRFLLDESIYWCLAPVLATMAKSVKCWQGWFRPSVTKLNSESYVLVPVWSLQFPPIQHPFYTHLKTWQIEPKKGIDWNKWLSL